MKKYIFIFFIGAFFLASCNKWLDVKPESEVELETLLQTETGFQEALNGIYASSNTSQTYGELICGFPDYLAGIYSQNFYGGLSNNEYKPFLTYNYTDKAVLAKCYTIWSSLYKSIALCNIIIEKIDAKKSIFTKNNYSIIKGEALALRGYLYFDLLRLFAPSYASKPEAKAIPYIAEFSLKGAPQSTVNEVITKILIDLNAAKALLKDTDPILSAAYIVGYPYTTADLANTKLTNESTQNDIFSNTRRDRMNYYAVCGELARVYLYKQDKVNALANAIVVIDSKKFPWATKERITTSDPLFKDRIFYTELIFSWYAPGLESNLTSKFESGDQGLFATLIYFNDAFETSSGGPGGTDMRYANMYNIIPGGTMMGIFKYHTDATSNMYELRLPAIRLSEMYYIAAECTIETNSTLAWSYFNKVRFQRGIPAELSGNQSTLISELIKEYRKEFYAEGQLFYMFKRLNRPISAINGSSTPAGDNIFVLPIPDAEVQYGNIVKQ